MFTSTSASRMELSRRRGFAEFFQRLGERKVLFAQAADLKILDQEERRFDAGEERRSRDEHEKQDDKSGETFRRALIFERNCRGGGDGFGNCEGVRLQIVDCRFQIGRASGSRWRNVPFSRLESGRAGVDSDAE